MTSRRPTKGKGIPDTVQWSTERRILDWVAKEGAGKFTRVDVRFRGQDCYIDAFVEPKDVGQNSPTHLCRIRYCGHPDRWAFFYYAYSHEKYEPNFMVTGDHYGTPEEALETATMFF